MEKSRLKTIVGIIAIVLGLSWIAFTIYTSQPHSYAIIGGADGPTSIYLAGNEYGLGTWITAVISGMVLAISGALLIIKKNR